MTVSAVGSAVGRAGNSGHLSNFNNILLEIQALDHKVSSNTLLDIYQALHQQMPAFSGEQMRRFNVLEVYQKLVAHPTASEHANEQARLATDLGDWQQLNNSFQEAYFYYVMALNWQESDERHRLATIAFLKWTFEKLAKSISTLKPEALNRVIDELFSFHSSAEEVEQLSEFITGIISSSGTRFNLLGQCARHFKERRSSPPPSSTDYLTKRHRTKFNKDFVVSFPKAQVSNSVVLESFTDMLRPMMEYMRDLIGPLPEGYDFRLIGSFARNEGCPASDFEWFGLVKEKEKSDELKLFAEGIHMLVSAFGKTPFTKNNLFVAKFPDIDQTHEGVGFRVDDGAHPALCDPRMLGTVEEFSEINSPDPDQKYDLSQEPYFNLILPSVSIFSDDEGSQLYSNYRELITEKLTPSVRSLWVQKAFEFLKENFDQTLPSKKLDLKMQFIRPLNLLIHLLALREGIEESNTIKIVEALPFFDSEVKNMIKTSVEAIYQMRIRLHQHYGAEIDAAPTSGPGAIFFTPQENRILQATHLLLLKPLYCSDTVNNLLADEIFDSLLSIGNENPKSLFEYFAALGVSMEFHGRSYRKLIDKVELASTYLQVLDKNGFNIQELAELQARDGWSYAEVQDIRYMADALQHITTDDPASGVVVQHSAIGRKYLHPDVAKQILDESGNIMEVESSCRHRVASAECSPFHLFFKQKPNHPMMEYAIHSLSYKTVGKSTPPTELVRFEVNGKAYPVLISQAIEGSTLKMASAVDINRASLTRMLLMSILTRPGDGLDSNYIIDDQGNIFCIDNDISFVEPVEKTLMGLLMGLKINFSSILFCFDQELLDPATLEAFTMLSPEDILHCWMTELIIKEQEYLALFSKDECAELYKEDKQGNRFTPSLLLKEGTTPTLCHQFDHLQRELIENNYQMTAQDLLKTLVSLGSEVGESVALRYSGAFTRRNRTPQERLKSVTGATQSMTSGNGFKASLGSIPSTGDIEKRKWFSLEEAKDELFPLIEQVSGGKYIKFDEKHRVLHVPFEKTDRHETVLKVAAKKVGAYGVPTELSLRGCKKISLSTLRPFLSDELRFLDLRNCPNLKSDMMELIAKKCPSLEELYLSSTEIEVVAEQTRFGQTRPLRMPNLKTLHISRCKNLRMIKLESPCLVHFKAKDNPMLREADLEAVFPIIDGSPCKPRTVWRDINIDLLKKILPLFPSTVFVENQYIYGILSDRLSESEIQKIFEPQNDCLTQLNLERNDIGDTGAQALAQVLAQTKITQLYLSWNSIGDAGAQALAQVLPQTQITQLDLGINKIGDAGAQALADVLPHTQITELNLERNSIGEAGAQAIAQVLKKTKITQLDLGNNNIGAAGALAIAQVLPQTQITQLDLGINKIGDAGAQFIGQVLPQTQITQLNLSENFISEAGAQAIVLTKTKITELDLERNYIRDAGAQALAQVLKKTQITQLDLRYNKIGDAGAQAIAQVLKKTQITQLDLSDNYIGEAGARALAQVLAQTKITELDLKDNSIGDKLRESIERALERNRARRDQSYAATMSEANTQSPDGDAK